MLPLHFDVAEKKNTCCYLHFTRSHEMKDNNSNTVNNFDWPKKNQFQDFQNQTNEWIEDTYVTLVLSI